MALAGLLALTQLAAAGEVTDTYAAGDTLTATMLDKLKSAINDNDSRLNAMTAADFSGYGTPFAADGAAKNVVVLAQELGGGTRYYVRSAYANSTETISVNGGAQVVPFIFNFAVAETDPGGMLTSITNYIEAPDTAAYLEFFVEQSTYDPVSIVKTVTADTLRESWLCGGSSSNVNSCVSSVTLSASGDFANSYSWTSARVLADGPLTVSGMTFDDVRMREIVNRGIFRVEAKGIGEVLRVVSGNVRRLVYYRVNGSTGGSLAGTPFEAGQPLDGVFF
jgi:hypothetical protein